MEKSPEMLYWLQQSAAQVNILDILQWITTILAAAGAFYAILTQRQAARRTRNQDYDNLRMDFHELLSINSRFEMVLRAIFLENPELNGRLKSEWLEASINLNKMREKWKS